MENHLFRSKFDEIRDTYFKHEGFVINENDRTIHSRSSFQSQSTKSSTAKLNDIRLRKKLSQSKSRSLLKAIKCRKTRVCSRIDVIKSTSALRDLEYELRLNSNMETSDRRLQELIFECLGEYEKAHGRAARRSTHLSSSIDKKLGMRDDDHQWSFFLSKIEDDCPNFRFHGISPSKMSCKFADLSLYFDEISQGKEDVRSKVLDSSLKVSRIVQISHKSGRAPRKRRENMDIFSKVVSASDEQIDRLLMDLLRSIGKSNNDNKSESSGADQPQGGFKSKMMLSARPLSWLLLSSPTYLGSEWKGMVLANCRIYFHVEERASCQLDKKNQEGSVVDAITTLYGGRLTPLPRHISVTSTINQHRSNSQFEEYPDIFVHESEEGSHHFAPATVEQLAETRTYTQGEKCLEHLYVVMHSKDNPSTTLRLLPLPKELIRVLISTYVSDTSVNTLLPSAKDIIPTSVSQMQDSYFCLVRSPSYQPRVDSEVDSEEDPPAPYAFLFQFCSEDHEEASLDLPMGSTQGAKSKNQWDSKILWNFCRWRSCMCPSTSYPSPKYLCTHHSLLKASLEALSKKKNESARFLPRKPPVLSEVEAGTTKSDLLMIKAASSLVEELVEDKLASTIETFCHRMRSDHALLRQKHCSKFSSKDNARDEATWKRWGSPGVLEQTMHDIEVNTRAGAASFSLEHATTLEIQNLVSQGVYPVAEVALIQKELKNDVDLFDVTSSQRKFELISSLVHHSKSER